MQFFVLVFRCVYCLACWSTSTVFLTSTSVTMYGSQLEAGRRSSMYPYPASPTCRGIRTLAPRLATPEENWSYLAVSCRPAKSDYFCKPHSPNTLLSIDGKSRVFSYHCTYTRGNFLIILYKPFSALLSIDYKSRYFSYTFI